MATIRDRGGAVRKFIVENLDQHPTDIVKVVSARFLCTRQAVHQHLRRLVEEGAIEEAGHTRNKVYRLAPLVKWERRYPLDGRVGEDAVWRDAVAPSLGPMPADVLSIWQYGFTEMLNNAIDHSGGTTIVVRLSKTAATTTVEIFDDGVGIFRKIQHALNLLDERHAVLELAKGKFTTDPARHSGEGIFFTSRMFDDFQILSGGVYFSHAFTKPEDWIVQTSHDAPGTLVSMALHNHTSRTTKKVFDQFSTDDDYGFTKTVVPVRLATYGDDNLVSRSQAKRLLARIDRFKVVVFDFSGVSSIGQAFADEVFRVFAGSHPQIEISAIHTGSEVKRMISRARSLGHG